MRHYLPLAFLLLLSLQATLLAQAWEGTYTVSGEEKVFLCERKGMIFGAHWLAPEEILSFFSVNVTAQNPAEARGYVATAVKGEGTILLVRSQNGNVELKQQYNNAAWNKNVTTTKTVGGAAPTDVQCFFTTVPVEAFAAYWIGSFASSEEGHGSINETVCLQGANYIGSNYYQTDAQGAVTRGTLEGKVYPHQGFYGKWQDADNATSTGAQFYLMTSLMTRLSWAWGDSNQPEGTESYTRGPFPSTMSNQVCIEGKNVVPDARGQYAVHPSEIKGMIHVCSSGNKAYGAIWETPSTPRGFLEFSNQYVFGAPGMTGKVMEIGPSEATLTTTLIGSVIEVKRVFKGATLITHALLVSSTPSASDCLYADVADSAYQGYWTGSGSNYGGGGSQTNETVCLTSTNELLLTYIYKDSLETINGKVINSKIYTNRGIIGTFDESGVQAHQFYHLDSTTSRRSWYWKTDGSPDGGSDTFTKAESTEIRGDGKCYKVSDPHPSSATSSWYRSQVANVLFIAASLLLVLVIH